MNEVKIQTVVSCSPKIMEKVMFNRLINHINKYAILSPNQYGFKKLLINSAVYTLLNTILNALNNKSKCKENFCDFENTFDCVNHNILLH
jgi:hypothetical protein